MGDDLSGVSQPASSGGSYRTNGFLFSDLRGYTAYVEARGDEAGAALLGRYRALVRSTVERHEGAEIRTEGDSFYVVFPSASSAVRCALAIVAASARPPDGGEAIRVGVGVHAGETVPTSEGYVGSAVNIAARICVIASPGEVLVSETVRGLTRTLLPVRFERRGRRRLKGIEEPVQLFAVRSAGPATGAAVVRGPSRTLMTLAGAGAVGAALLVIVVASAIRSEEPDGSARASTSAPTTPDVSPSSEAGPASFPVTSAERNLLGQIPIVYQAGCLRSDQPLQGSNISLRCPLPFGEEADEVWYDRFSGASTMVLVLDGLIAEQQLSGAGCTVDDPEGHDEWGVGNLWSGRRVCYAQGGASWIWWSYDQEDIIARVVRRDGEWTQLIEWWEEYSALLRRSP